jgi:glutathione S-transferase
MPQHDPEHRPELALYYYDGCPFCDRVRAALDDLGIRTVRRHAGEQAEAAPDGSGPQPTVELRHIHLDPQARSELVEARDRPTVPVLRILDSDGSEDWMPESKDIVQYLYDRFGDGRPGLMASGMLDRSLNLLMWALLIAGVLTAGGTRAALWTVACTAAATRSFIMGTRSRAMHHWVIGPTFAVAAMFIALDGLNIASVPWWYGAYVVIAILLLVVTVGQIRRAKGET